MEDYRSVGLPIKNTVVIEYSKIGGFLTHETRFLLFRVAGCHDTFFRDGQKKATSRSTSQDMAACVRAYTIGQSYISEKRQLFLFQVKKENTELRGTEEALLPSGHPLRANETR